MFCGKCGVEIQKGTTFCPQCGQKQGEGQQQVGREVLPGQSRQVGITWMYWLNLAAWGVICLNMLVVVLDYSEYVERVMDAHRESPAFFMFLFYGMLLLAPGLAAVSHKLIRQRNRSVVLLGSVPAMFMVLVFFVLKATESVLEDQMMDSVENLRMYAVAGVYAESIWPVTWLAMVVSGLVALMRMSTIEQEREGRG